MLVCAHCSRLVFCVDLVINSPSNPFITTTCLPDTQMDLDDLAKQWEDGDDEEELKTEEQTKFERLERRRKEAQAKASSLDPRYVWSCLYEPDLLQMSAAVWWALPSRTRLHWCSCCRHHLLPSPFPSQALVYLACLLYTSPSPRDATLSRMPSSA